MKVWGCVAAPFIFMGLVSGTELKSVSDTKLKSVSDTDPKAETVTNFTRLLRLRSCPNGNK